MNLKEEEKRNQEGWEHLKDKLHVLIEVELEEPAATAAMAKAKDIIERLLIPVVSTYVL
jgi:hypothetical protein